MMSFSPAPIFSGSWDHRPAVSSPLSSSPVRASSPLSPIDRNVCPQRQVQSSPIKPPKFRFSSRPTRPNPVNKKRDELQEGRRKVFLQNVRQSREEKAWQRRDIEGQFLKTNYLADRGQLSQDAPDITEADIEDAMTFYQEQPPIPEQDEDETMMDEEEQLEAMFASYEEQQQQMASSQRPLSPPLSDEDYDDVFAELIAQEQFKQNKPPRPQDQIDTSGDIEMQ